MNYSRKKIILLIFCIFIPLLSYAKVPKAIKSYEPHCSNCEAILLGRITNEKILLSRNSYLTEYKLKPKKWLFKKPYIKETKYVKLKVLGAVLPEKGIVIKSSCSPDYIPIKNDAIFILKKNKLKQKDTFTLGKNSIIYLENAPLSLQPEELSLLLKNIEEI